MHGFTRTRRASTHAVSRLWRQSQGGSSKSRASCGKRPTGIQRREPDAPVESREPSYVAKRQVALARAVEVRQLLRSFADFARVGVGQHQKSYPDTSRHDSS